MTFALAVSWSDTFDVILLVDKSVLFKSITFKIVFEALVEYVVAAFDVVGATLRLEVGRLKHRLTILDIFSESVRVVLAGGASSGVISTRGAIMGATRAETGGLLPVKSIMSKSLGANRSSYEFNNPLFSLFDIKIANFFELTGFSSINLYTATGILIKIKSGFKLKLVEIFFNINYL